MKEYWRKPMSHENWLPRGEAPGPDAVLCPVCDVWLSTLWAGSTVATRAPWARLAPPVISATGPAMQHATTCRCCTHGTSRAKVAPTEKPGLEPPGTEWTEAEATARINEWCARGLGIPDVAGGKQRHMAIKPRDFRPEEVRGEAELAAARSLCCTEKWAGWDEENMVS